MTRQPTTYDGEFGIRTPKGWLAPTSGGGQFFRWSPSPAYPFRSEAGAKQVASDWRIEQYEVVRR